MSKEIAKKETQEIQVSSPAQMIQMAVQGGADVGQLKELLELQKDWEANEAKKAYHIAMAKFKENAPEINKDKTVGYAAKGGKVGYAHASIGNVVSKVTKELSKHGLSHSWTTKQNGSIIVTCKITHAQGHSEETSLSASSDNTGNKNSIQAMGSTITYLERYTLLSILGLATHDQDDDAISAVPQVKITNKELSWIRDEVSSLDINQKKLCEYLGVEDFEDLTEEGFKKAKVALGETRKRKEAK